VRAFSYDAWRDLIECRDYGCLPLAAHSFKVRQCERSETERLGNSIAGQATLTTGHHVGEHPDVLIHVLNADVSRSPPLGSEVFTILAGAGNDFGVPA
jgi:hypothetical protein